MRLLFDEAVTALAKILTNEEHEENYEGENE